MAAWYLLSLVWQSDLCRCPVKIVVILRNAFVARQDVPSVFPCSMQDFSILAIAVRTAVIIAAPCQPLSVYWPLHAKTYILAHPPHYPNQSSFLPSASFLAFSFATFSLLAIHPSAPTPPNTNPTPTHCIELNECRNQTTLSIIVSIFLVTVTMTSSKLEKRARVA